MATRGRLEGAAALATVAGGSLLHFTYQWSGRSPLVAWFSATDESVAAHLALLNLPWLVMTVTLWAVVRWRRHGRRGSKGGEVVGVDEVAGVDEVEEDEDEDVWLSRALGLAVALAVVPAVYYSYTVGATRPSLLAVDLVTFVVAVGAGCLVSWAVAKRVRSTRLTLALGLVLHLTLFGLLVLFCYWKPAPDREPFRVRSHA